MAYLASTLVTAPNGFWEKIIFAFNGAVKNYALAIILITLCIKLIMLPIDFFNRKASLKMTEVQAKLQPKINEIQRKYKDKNIQNQKMSELYQRENFKPMGSCLGMLGVMIATLVIFITLFNGLNAMAAYKIEDQYEQLKVAYIQTYVEEEQGDVLSNLNLTAEQIDEYVLKISTKQEQETDEEVQARVEIALNNVQEKYDDVKESFLWIKNVWMADSPFKKSVLSFDSYVSNTKVKFENKEEKAQAKVIYDEVMSGLEDEKSFNGLFILPILAGVTAFLSQYLNKKKKHKKENFYTQNAKQSDQEKAQNTTEKVMMLILPIIMVIFTINYNAIFAIYIVTNQLLSTATAPLINKLLTIKKKK